MVIACFDASAPIYRTEGTAHLFLTGEAAFRRVSGPNVNVSP